MAATPIAALPAGMSADEKRVVVMVREAVDRCGSGDPLAGIQSCPAATRAIEQMSDLGWCGSLEGGAAGEGWQWRRCAWSQTAVSRRQMSEFRKAASPIIGRTAWAILAVPCAIITPRESSHLTQAGDRAAANLTVSMTEAVRRDALGWYSRMIENEVATRHPDRPSAETCAELRHSAQ